jgi:hypothetical protein
MRTTISSKQTSYRLILHFHSIYWQSSTYSIKWAQRQTLSIIRVRWTLSNIATFTILPVCPIHKIPNIIKSSILHVSIILCYIIFYIYILHFTLQYTVGYTTTNECYNVVFIKIRMLQRTQPLQRTMLKRTDFINKIRMLQRTQMI